MITKHTEIIGGEIVNGSPSSYRVNRREDGSLINVIAIQKGPVQEVGVNGIFIEDLILISIDQLEHFQRGPFSCEENERTLNHLRDALAATRSRQYERTLRGVQGRNKR